MTRSAMPPTFCDQLIRTSLWRWVLVLACLAMLPRPALAQAAKEDPDAELAAARETVEEIEQQLEDKKLGTSTLPDVRRQLLELQQRAEAIVAEQGPLLESAQARLGELGAAAGAAEAPDIAAQRKALQSTASEIDARLKLARLLVVTSEQLADTADTQARERFTAELFDPTDSLLGTRFRSRLAAALPSDSLRLARTWRDFRELVEGRTRWHWLGAAAMLAAAVALRAWLHAFINRAVLERAPPGRLRRSSHALALSVLALLVPGTAALAWLVAVGDAADEPAWTALFAAATGIALFCAYVAGLGRALLSPRQPSWRLPQVSDAVAERLAHAPAWLALTLFVGWLLQRLAGIARVSLSMVIALEALVALALALALVRLISVRRRLLRQAPPAAPRTWWLAALTGTAWLLLVGAIAAMLGGYVALGSFIVGQLIWTLVLLGTGYLLWVFIDDAAAAWAALPPSGSAADELQQAAGLRRGQVAVLASALLRVLVLLVLMVLLLAPFGEGPAQLLTRGLRLREGLTVGELQLRPAAMALAVIVIVVALAVVRLLQRWTALRLLPTTSLDAGMQASLVTLLGFVGSVLAVAMGLSAMGLALNQVAWIASALTVGIGFGLQAVVSNFVSGLILLAERPVKVGDWIALGGLEGDIRRINVRTTEIEMPDRSTVIVPNSEFITKVVRNVTHGVQAQGFVQVRLPMPLDCDAEQVRATLLRAFTEHKEVLQEPPPKVLLDGIEGDKLVFNASGFVSSPRLAAGTRSELLLRLMKELKGSGGSQT